MPPGLLGGTLVMTPLNAADGDIYAVAQGTIIAGGVSVKGDAASVTEGVPTAGTIPAGARVEREIAFEFASLATVRLALRNPDFTTAARIEDVLNTRFRRSVARNAGCGNGRTRHCRHAPPSAAHAIGMIEMLEVEPESTARVVVDQRSGTIVLGADVRIDRVAVAQGNLTLRIEEAPLVAEPNPVQPGRDGCRAAQPRRPGRRSRATGRDSRRHIARRSDFRP